MTPRQALLHPDTQRELAAGNPSRLQEKSAVGQLRGATAATPADASTAASGIQAADSFTDGKGGTDAP